MKPLWVVMANQKNQQRQENITPRDYRVLIKDEVGEGKRGLRIGRKGDVRQKTKMPVAAIEKELPVLSQICTSNHK